MSATARGVDPDQLERDLGELPATVARLALQAEAARQPDWFSTTLEDGWSLSVRLEEGWLAIRFRAIASPDLAWVAFLCEAKLRIQRLGSYDWTVREGRIGLWHQVTFARRVG